MKSTEIAKGILKALLVVAVFVLLVILIYGSRVLIGYILIAAVLALLGRPMVVFLRRRLKFPNVLAVTFFLVLTLGSVIAVIATILPVLREQSENLSLLRIENLESEIGKIYRKISDALGTSPGKVKEVVEVVDIGDRVMGNIEIDLVPSLFTSVLSVLASIGVGLFSVLFISFFFLKDSKIIQRLILRSVPRGKEAQVLNSVVKVKNLLPRYFAGLLGQVGILFTIYAIILLAVGIEDAAVIAFFCALFNIIPYLGPIIGGLIMLAFTVLGHLEPGLRETMLSSVGLVSLGIVVGQLIDNFFSQPYIFSNSVRSHPLEVFLVILLAGTLFGIVGMIVAVPGYTVAKVILKEFFADNRIIGYITKDI